MRLFVILKGFTDYRDFQNTNNIDTNTQGYCYYMYSRELRIFFFCQWGTFYFTDYRDFQYMYYQNNKYFELIQEFENITGIGAILNTSFNLHGEPVVNNPSDALKTFTNSKIDVLLIGNILIKRKSH